MCEAKTCPQCKKTKNISEFYNRRGKEGSSPYCKECTNIQTLTRQRKLKQEAILSKGGKCQCCGYDKYQGALEFHHLNPKEKDFTIGNTKSTTFGKIKTELDKCILVCSNCHREIHGGIINVEGIVLSKPKEIIWENNKPKGKPEKKNRSTKIIWPSNQELKVLVWEKPRTLLAKELGVSDVAISKKCKKEKIEQPPRGYWTKFSI